MKFPQHRITAAAHVVHNNYSDVDVFEAEIGELVWAEGTVRAAIERLGNSEEYDALIERHDALRAHALSLGRALTLAWEAAGGDAQNGFGARPQDVPEAVRAAIEAARAPQSEIEITDSLVEAVGNGIFPPNVVYDRERVRAVLANALQTR